MIFNPGAAQTIKVDLSSLPPDRSAAVPVDLFTNTSGPPLAATGASRCVARSDGFSLGRAGEGRLRGDGYRRPFRSAPRAARPTRYDFGRTTPSRTPPLTHAPGRLPELL